MKFQLEQADGVNHIAKMEAGRIWVGETVHLQSVLVPWSGAVQTWTPQRFEDLDAAHFESLLDFRPELVILSTGTKHRFVHPRLHAALMAERIGLEAMELHAACRTFNVLAGEGRKVLAAILLA
ncbi:uncharacterized protein HNQ51_000863 [Inhella inkyongensis]|uniref:Mth938-like domain-containing protein n=1 Tax=Inhella inkyongensis TaxID=392593 RepID=A0A840S4X5_9BURK|nr:MTH938/NDUFAF3 family protein [Inhella inkyongensis]MBB5203570.1 uncharacterized protein [Inhella inkyongensis]